METETLTPVFASCAILPPLPSGLLATARSAAMPQVVETQRRRRKTKQMMRRTKICHSPWGQVLMAARLVPSERLVSAARLAHLALQVVLLVSWRYLLPVVALALSRLAVVIETASLTMQNKSLTEFLRQCHPQLRSHQQERQERQELQ